MTYDSLLLNCGGGVMSQNKKSEQYKGAATLAIGIGGTGVAALSSLKSKVYQQLLADDPGSAVPTYQHIQFLAIDSDESDLKTAHGNGRLEPGGEFFSISNSNLAEIIKGKTSILIEHTLDWMDIDHISGLLSPQGAGGVRQIGRYLLINKSGELRAKIEGKIKTALSGAGADQLNVYIFAGISGGTGSGCFLDTCYIVRYVLQSNGFGGKVMGFFFLPDVVTSKPAVAAKKESVKYNNSNGYAAMKELDYLMDLKSANDRFYQSYNGFTVNTQEPPVDMCHLISATQSSGHVLKNGFGYAINVSTDYVMAYLADVDTTGSKNAATDKGLTMEGHLSNVTTGVSLLKRQSGANLNYHVLGASNAEIPMAQISTYLAAGFYHRFHEEIKAETVVPAKEAVDECARKLGITEEAVMQSLNSKTEMIQLPDIDTDALRAYGAPLKDHSVQPWARGRNDFLARNAGKRKANQDGLNSKLKNFSSAEVNGNSLLAKTFLKLCELARDPSYGPYYAARMLSNPGYDLFSVIEGAIKQADEHLDAQLINVENYEQQRLQAATDFCNPGPLEKIFGMKKLYDLYKSAEEQCGLLQDRIQMYTDIKNTLRTFKENLGELKRKFFDPMIEVLNALYATFEEDRTFLNGASAKASDEYTWRIFELEDIRPTLDKRIEELTPKELVTDFIAAMLRDPDSWLKNDDTVVGRFVNQYMEKVFGNEMNRSLQSYLAEKYKISETDPDKLAKAVETDLISKVDSLATAMFWCAPTFQIVASTFPSSTLSVPSVASAICSGAESFAAAHKDYVTRKTGLQDRIFALRFCSGVPLYAYQGITLLKEDYDKAISAHAANGIGAHLYSKTGRGTDGTGDKNWANLPVPMPYSVNPAMVPGGAALSRLYDDGVARRIIYGKKEGNNTTWYVRGSKDFELPQFKLADFLVDEKGKPADTLNKARMEKERLKLDALEARRFDDHSLWVELRNDGDDTFADVVERVRKDYFIHYPKLQEMVTSELAKSDQLAAARQSLDEIEAEHNNYEQDLKRWSQLVFFGGVECLDSHERPVNQENISRLSVICYRYADHRGLQKTVFFTHGSMPYGKRYPLYQGFVTYRSLDADTEPRHTLDQIAAASEGKKLETGHDNVMAYLLQQVLEGPDGMMSIAKSASMLEAEEKEAILRFYAGFMRQIQELEVKFSAAEWQQMPQVAAAQPVQQAAAAAPAVPQFARQWYVWDGYKQMVVYENSSLYYAWDGSNWVQLTAQMQVLNPRTNAWQPLPVDAAGNVDIRQV